MKNSIGALILSLALSVVVWPQTPHAAPPEGAHLIPSLDGGTLFMNYCAVCHGKFADGDGPMASVLKVPVPNLTEIAKRNNGKFPFEKIERRIEGNAASVTAHGTKEMPVWGPIFSQVTTDADYGKVRIHNITKYLESIQK